MKKFNEHILLVIKWLQNKDSVSEKELRLSYTVAYTAGDAPAYAPACAVDRAAARAAYDAADRAAYDASNAATDAVCAAASAANADADEAYFTSAANAAEAAYAAACVDTTKYFINSTKEHLNEYFKLTKEDRQEYEQQARYLNVLGGSND